MILVKVIGFCILNRPDIGLFRAFLNFQSFSFKVSRHPRHQGQITDHNFPSLGIDKVKIAPCTV